MKTVTFTAGMHFNKPVTGTFELVKGFTPWAGAVDGDGKRRVGTSGQAFLKVRGVSNFADEKVRNFKVTVTGLEQGYVVNEDVVEDVVEDVNAELVAEVAALVAEKAAATPGAERSRVGKRLARRVAKLAALEA